MIPQVKDKQKPHYVLGKLKVLFESKKTRHITALAHKGAVSMGYMDDDDIQSVISRLCSEHFYKSMTAYENHKVWQDVYKFKDGDKALYLKLQLSVDGRKAVLIQMKRDEGRDK
jgi:motility quorum-sensing regulator / GCU-specific mRNA interferase toxin